MARRIGVEPRKTGTQRRAVETYERILDAAARLLTTTGYSATTTNHIAAAASISIGSLYQYFPNKEAVVAALAERHVSQMAAAWQEQDEQLLATQTVGDLVETMVRLAMRLGDARLHGILFREAIRTPSLQLMLDKFDDQISEILAVHLRRLGLDDIHLDVRARLAMAAADEALHRVVLTRQSSHDRGVATAALVSMITAGLQAR